MSAAEAQTLEVDGIAVEFFELQVTGKIKMSASDLYHRATMEKLTLGAFVEVTAFCSVQGKTYRLVSGDGGETVTATTIARVDSVDVL